VRAVPTSVSRVVLIVAMGFFLAAVLHVGHYHFIGPGLWHATIDCSPSLRELGKITGSEPVSFSFAVTNSGSRPLVIERVRGSCGSCINVVSYPTQPIVPGGNGVIEAVLSVERLSGAVQKAIAVFSNDPIKPAVILKVRANVGNATDRGDDDAR
jgi:hypothetical protein